MSSRCAAVIFLASSGARLIDLCLCIARGLFGPHHHAHRAGRAEVGALQTPRENRAVVVAGRETLHGEPEPRLRELLTVRGRDIRSCTP